MRINRSNFRQIHAGPVPFPGSKCHVTPVNKKEDRSKRVVDHNFEEIAEEHHKATNIGEYWKINQQNENHYRG